MIDTEEAHHAFDEVIECGAEVGRAAAFIVTPPAIEAEAVVLVFFKGRCIEHAQYIFADLHCLDVVAGFSGGTPVEVVDVLEHGEYGLRGKPLLEQRWQMLRGKVRLAKQDNDECVGMAAAQICDHVGGVAVAGSDLA